MGSIFNCRVCGQRSLALRDVDLGAIGKAKVCPDCIQKAQTANANIGGQPIMAAPPPDLKVFVLLRHEKGVAVFVNLMSTIFAFYREEDAQGFLKALKEHPNVRLVGNEQVEQVYAMGVFEWAKASKSRLVSIARGIPALPAPVVRRAPPEDDGGHIIMPT